MSQNTSRNVITAVVAALAILALGAGAFQSAMSVNVPSVAIEGAWARPAQEGGNTAVYMTIANREGRDLRLAGVDADVAQAAELHETAIGADYVARMHPVDAVALPAGGTIRLEPGGLHIMLLELTKPLHEGDHFVVRLVFEGYDPVSVAVPVQMAGDRAGEGPAHAHP